MFYQLVKDAIENKKVSKFKRGEIIYHEGESPQKLYFIESGLIGLFHVADSGKETFFRVFTSDDILGHRSYIAKEPYHASAIALMPTQLICIDKDEYERLFEENIELQRQLIQLLAKDLGQAELRLAGLLDKSANKRISESLVYLKLKYPDYVWTRKEIAEYAGSTFETVTRVMTTLESNGFIKKEGRDFSILSISELLNLNEEDLTRS